MSAGHTPGPWLHRGKSDSVHKASDTHPFGGAIFQFVDTDGPSDADLKLILAAPDLLVACKRLLIDVRWEAARADIVTDEARADIALAEAAIAKATGSAP